MHQHPQCFSKTLSRKQNSPSQQILPGHLDREELNSGAFLYEFPLITTNPNPLENTTPEGRTFFLAT